jgi:hypothetical protein
MMITSITETVKLLLADSCEVTESTSFAELVREAGTGHYGAMKCSLALLGWLVLPALVLAQDSTNRNTHEMHRLHQNFKA